MTPARLLLLVRHADAEKNALGQFSGDASSDRLTAAGKLQLDRLSYEIEMIIRELKVASVGIAHADSQRAKATADALAHLCSQRAVAVSGFRSIRSGIASGLTEAEIAEKYTKFSNSLKLYREGVISSYDIPYPQGAERVVDFEAEVKSALQALLERDNSDLQIVVGHRSSITASLLHYARIAHKYPRDFFGFIPLTACVTSCVDTTPGRERILWVNRPVSRASLLDTTRYLNLRNT